MAKTIPADTIHFSKMSGTGNDFIVIDNMSKQYSLNWSENARKLCPRRIGVGADGILLIEPCDETDFTMKIFNADGSEAEMCGNGARCAADFAYSHGIAPKQMCFKTLAGLIDARIDKDAVAIKMIDPYDMQQDIDLPVSGRNITIYSINTGVPHAILFCEDVSGMEIETLGPAIRYHQHFSPAGSNVDFVEISDKSQITVRTYERGVEAETLACGTGAVASALLSYAFRDVSGPPVHVNMPGGQLIIDFQVDDEQCHDVWLIGPVDTVYTGQIII